MSVRCNIVGIRRPRELEEALRRRCIYHWIGYPTPEREMCIVMMRASGVSERTAGLVAAQPYIDEIGGGSFERICSHVLEMASERVA
jgi:hypothetical protein